MRHSLFTLLAFLAVSEAAATKKPHKKCPLTEVSAYASGCNVKGFAQNPYNLGTKNHVQNVTQCATACLAKSKCKSFRYAQDSMMCYMYTKYLDYMDFSTENFEDGIFYDRQCFTNDCDTINACNSIASCPEYTVYGEGIFPGPYFDEFGCGYGLEAQSPYPLNQTTLPGNLPACNATIDCINSTNDIYVIVTYSIPDDLWVCSTSNRIYGFSYTPTPSEEYISVKTLLKPNSSIGAAYGYRVDGFYEYYGR